MKRFFSVVLGMLGALVAWQAIMAFLGLGLFFSGIYAGLSLIAFSLTLFIIGGALVLPKKEDLNER